MKYPRPPQTPGQWGTIVGFAIIAIGFLVFLWFEIPGMVNDVPEDTLTEWVVDLDAVWVWVFSIFLVAGGVMAVWAGPHFWEHYIRRRREERKRGR
jgi:hypothetical protein